MRSRIILNADILNADKVGAFTPKSQTEYPAFGTGATQKCSIRIAQTLPAQLKVTATSSTADL
jgi:hypothetical protein